MKRLALAALPLLAAVGGCNAGPAPIPTPAWGRPLPLQLRADAAPGTLLLRQAGGAVYRLVLPASLNAATEAQWQAAPGPVVECEYQRPAAAVRFESGQARLGAVPLVLGGARAENAVLSGSGSAAAVLSSSGERGSVAPALGSGAKPPFFVDLVELPSGRALQPTVRLPFAGRVSAVRACFSRDDRLLVIYDVMQTGLAVLAVGPGER